MSWTVYIRDEKDKTAKVTPAIRPSGQMQADVNEYGDFVAIPTTDAELYVTYNYSIQYRILWGEASLKALHNMNVKEAIPKLEEAVEKLGKEPYSDYWASTAGNAGFALWQIMLMCKEVDGNCHIEVS